MRIKKVAKNVDFILALFRRQFGPRDKFNLQRLASGSRALAALDRVMVRQRDGRQMVLRGLRHELLRRDARRHA